MTEIRVRLVAVTAALAAVLLRIATEGFLPASGSVFDPAAGPFVLLLLAGPAAPIAIFLVVAGPLRPRPRALRAGGTPGTLIAPARLLFPGAALIGVSWLICHSIVHPGLPVPLIALAVVDAILGVAFFVRPRPYLALDAGGVTIYSWWARRPVRVLWSDLHPVEPVWTANGTFTGTGTVARISLARTGAKPVPIPAVHLDVDPAYLARVMTELATAPDRRTFIDSNLSPV